MLTTEVSECPGVSQTRKMIWHTGEKIHCYYIFYAYKVSLASFQLVCPLTEMGQMNNVGCAHKELYYWK